MADLGVGHDCTNIMIVFRSYRSLHVHKLGYLIRIKVIAHHRVRSCRPVQQVVQSVTGTRSLVGAVAAQSIIRPHLWHIWLTDSHVVRDLYGCDSTALSVVYQEVRVTDRHSHCCSSAVTQACPGRPVLVHTWFD